MRHRDHTAAARQPAPATLGGERRQLLRQLLALGSAAILAPPASSATTPTVAVVTDAALARYAFPAPHPFDGERQNALLHDTAAAALLARAVRCGSRPATRAELLRFHTAAHIARVSSAEARGLAALDDGDTPVYPGIFTAACHVVGAALATLSAVMGGEYRRSLQPIGGLHHGARDHASGFCVFNDLGVVIATLRRDYHIERIAYVDIDAHHGDGVFYGFEDDAGVIIADIHQDGRTLFPGTGGADETGRGGAAGTKLNIALPPRAGDREFLAAWPAVEAHLARFAPQFFILQCGADGLAGDPLAQLEYSSAVHAYVSARVCALAARHAQGRVMAFGGGGYDHANLSQAWGAVLAALLA